MISTEKSKNTNIKCKRHVGNQSKREAGKRSEIVKRSYKETIKNIWKKGVGTPLSRRPVDEVECLRRIRAAGRTG